MDTSYKICGYDLIHTVYDDVRWDEDQALFEKWRDRLCTEDNARAAGDLVTTHRDGVPVTLHGHLWGSSNACLWMEYLDGDHVVIRFAVPGRVAFPEEKLRTEVAVMRFISKNTTIRIPFIHCSLDDISKSPDGLGPFIIMDYVKHKGDLADTLE